MFWIEKHGIFCAIIIAYMNEFKKRQRLKKIIYSRAIFGLLVVVCLLLVHAVWDIFWKYRASIEDERQLQAKLVSLTDEQAYLASSTADLESQNGVVYELQDKFGAVKPGEKEIVLVNTATSGNASASDDESVFGRIWNWLKNL